MLVLLLSSADSDIQKDVSELMLCISVHAFLVLFPFGVSKQTI